MPIERDDASMEVVKQATGPNDDKTCMRTPEEALVVLYDMVSEFRSLLNCCSVDFIVDNLFLEALSPALQKELAELDDAQVAGLPGLLLGAQWTELGISLGKGWLLVVDKFTDYILQSSLLTLRINLKLFNSALPYSVCISVLFLYKSTVC